MLFQYCLILFVMLFKIFSLKFMSVLFMTLPELPHIVQYYSIHGSRSYVSQLMQASPPMSQCLARVLFRTAILLLFLAALLPMPALASSSALSSLIVATAASCCDRRCQDYIFAPAFFTFPRQKVHFPQTPSLFPHMTFQSLGYILKRPALFRVCQPNVLG